jgi:hypothetical protein
VNVRLRLLGEADLVEHVGGGNRLNDRGKP